MYIKEIELFNFLNFKRAVFQFTPTLDLNPCVILKYRLSNIDWNATKVDSNEQDALLLAIKCICSRELSSMDEDKVKAMHQANRFGFVRIELSLDKEGSRCINAVRAFHKWEDIFFKYGNTKSSVSAPLFSRILTSSSHFGKVNFHGYRGRERNEGNNDNILKFMCEQHNKYLQVYENCMDSFKHIEKVEPKSQEEKELVDRLKYIQKCSQMIMEERALHHKAQILDVAKKVSDIFKLFTSNLYELQFFVPVEAERVHSDLQIADLNVDKIITMINSKDVQQIWHQSADLLKDILKAALQIVIAKHFEHRILVLDEIHSDIPLLHTIGKANLLQLIPLEQPRAADFCVSFLENILKCCNDMNMLAIIPFGSEKSLMLDGANIVSFSRSNIIQHEEEHSIPEFELSNLTLDHKTGPVVASTPYAAQISLQRSLQNLQPESVKNAGPSSSQRVQVISCVSISAEEALALTTPSIR